MRPAPVFSVFIVSFSFAFSKLTDPLNDNVFQSFLSDAYSKISHDNEKEQFMKHIWPSIMADFIPDTVVVPAEENTWENIYTCATETKMYPKLKNPSSAEVTADAQWNVFEAPNHIKIEVEVGLEFTKPLSFELAEKTNADDNPVKTPVEYSFKDGSKVKILLAIPDFTKINKVDVTSKCLVKVVFVSVIKLGEPVVEKANAGDKEKELARSWVDVIKADYHNLLSVGVMKAVKNHIPTDSWICAHQGLVASEKELENGDNWRYSDSYEQYCSGKRAN